MPGVLGIAPSAIAPQLEARCLHNMLQSLLHYPWYQSTQKSVPGASLGLVSLNALTGSSFCVTSKDERYALAFDGELYNEDELREALNLNRKDGKAQDDQTYLVLLALQRWGSSALERFNGLFQLAFWDAQTQELIVGCDPAGLRPIYFAHQAEKIAFAPEAKALLVLPWVSREIDFDGVLSFLRHGFVLGDRTFFADIKVLPGGCFARFQRGCLEIHRYFKMRFAEKPQMRETEIRERFVETWRDVMRRQTHGDSRIGALLSGGLDSRLILAGLDKPAPTFTMGQANCQDYKVAKQTAEAAGCLNLFSPILPDEAPIGLKRAVYLTDGMFNCFHANVRHVLPSLTETVDVVFDGICPLDSFYNAIEIPLRRLLGKASPLHWLREAVASIDLHDFPVGKQQRLNLFSAAHKSQFEKAATRDSLDEFIRLQQQHAAGATSLLDLFRFEERQHRLFNFGPLLLRSVVEVRCPYFDKKMLELMRVMAPSHRSEDKPLHKYAIQQLAPDLAQIPWERTGLPLTAGAVKTNLRLGSKFVRRQLKKIFVDSSADKMVDYNGMLRSSTALQNFVTSHLLEGWPHRSGFFDRRQVQALLQHHLDGKGNHADLIGRLLTVELWHQLFVHQTPLSRVNEFLITIAA
jgi:asparagine synthase (glutamine-hydrolysing)